MRLAITTINYKTYSLFGLGMFCGTSHAATIQEQQREAIIVEIKQGKVNEGIIQLDHLRQQNLSDQKILADYIIVLYQAQRFRLDQISILNHLDIKTYPNYGQIILVKALRDLKQLTLAQYYTKQFIEQKNSNDLQLLLGIIQAELHNNAQAELTLKHIKPSALNNEQLAQLSYAYRIIDQPIEALNAAQMAISEPLPSKNVQEQYIYALIATSDFKCAEQYIAEHQLENTIKHIDYTVKTREFSQEIKDAIQYYKIKNSQGKPLNAYDPLDQVLNQMQNYEAQLPNDINLKRIFYYDYIYALNFRMRNQDVIENLVKIHQTYEQMPPFIRQAAADSFLRLRQAHTAEYLYKSLLKEKNYADYNVYSSLYYALLEQEKYPEANQLITNMDHLLPTFRYSAAKGVNRTTHEDRTDYLALKGLNEAYNNKNAQAEHYFQELTAKAPNNIGYQNNLATLQRWRNKPHASSVTLAQFNGIKPIPLSTLINQMQNAQALNQVKTWRELNAQLNTVIPEDSAVQLSRKELADRNRPSIEHNSVFAQSRSDQSNVLQNLTGSKEQLHNTKMNSPWFANAYRAYITRAQRHSVFSEQNLNDERFGLGTEWLNNRRSAYMSLTNRSHGRGLGLQAGWSQWLNDTWQYSLAFDSQADIPLQALSTGNRGQSYQAGITWQDSDTRNVVLTYKGVRINDGNHQHEVAASYNQQIAQSAHHITWLSLKNEYDRNSNVQVNYFNPHFSNSAEILLAHDWITWRCYERNLTQHIEIGIGIFSQSNYSNKALFNLFYGHKWQLSRTWSLDYGLGWSNHPYDGNAERKTYLQFGFEGLL